MFGYTGLELTKICLLWAFKAFLAYLLVGLSALLDLFVFAKSIYKLTPRPRNKAPFLEKGFFGKLVCIAWHLWVIAITTGFTLLGGLLMGALFHSGFPVETLYVFAGYAVYAIAIHTPGNFSSGAFLPPYTSFSALLGYLALQYSLDKIGITYSVLLTAIAFVFINYLSIRYVFFC